MSVGVIKIIQSYRQDAKDAKNNKGIHFLLKPRFCFWSLLGGLGVLVVKRSLAVRFDRLLEGA